MSNKPPSEENPPSMLGPLTTPLTLRGWPAWLVYALAAVSLIYILNPTLGIFELLPDNLPVIGNLDEGVAFLLLWAGAVEFFEGRKIKKALHAKAVPLLQPDTLPSAHGQAIEGSVVEDKDNTNTR